MTEGAVAGTFDAMAELRVAVVGTGRIAAQHLAAVRRLGTGRLVAVADRSPVTAEAMAERHGIPVWFTDHRVLLDEVRPDVVHITTPVGSHVAIAEDCLAAGAHVIVEKPLAPTIEEVHKLLRAADHAGRHLVEDYNYLFNRTVRRIGELVDSGRAGDVVHVDVELCLDLERGGFADANLEHPAVRAPGGVVSDLVTHMASLVHRFVGSHRDVTTSWTAPEGRGAHGMRTVAMCAGGTATMSFTSRAQPDSFTVRVACSEMRATAGLFEPRVVVERVRSLPAPLVPLTNGLAEAAAVAKGAVGGLWGKLNGGPGSYDGLWTLVAATHAALIDGRPPPISPAQIAEVNELVTVVLAGAPAP